MKEQNCVQKLINAIFAAAVMTLLFNGSVFAEDVLIKTSSDPVTYLMFPNGGVGYDGIVSSTTDMNDPNAVFELIRHDDGYVSFKTPSEKYMLAYLEGGAHLHAWSNVVDDAAKFKIFTNADGTVSIQAFNGQHYIANHSWGIEANAEHAYITTYTDTGKFEIIDTNNNPVYIPKKIFIKTSTEDYLMFPDVSLYEIIASTSVQGNQKAVFELNYLSDGNIAFRTAAGGYMFAWEGGPGHLHKYADIDHDWAKFNIVQNSDGTVFIKTLNGHYIGSWSWGTMASGGTGDPQTKYTLVDLFDESIPLHKERIFSENTTITEQTIIEEGETWTIHTGVTLTIDYYEFRNEASVRNEGTINNYGTLIIKGPRPEDAGSGVVFHDCSMLRNFNTINNRGTIHIYGELQNVDTINNYSMIQNSGALTNYNFYDHDARTFENIPDICDRGANMPEEARFINFEDATLTNWAQFYDLCTTIENHGTISNAPSADFIHSSDNFLNNGSIVNWGFFSLAGVGQLYNTYNAKMTNLGTLQNLYGAHFQNSLYSTLVNSGHMTNEGVVVNTGVIQNLNGNFTGTIPTAGNPVE